MGSVPEKGKGAWFGYRWRVQVIIWGALQAVSGVMTALDGEVDGYRRWALVPEDRGCSWDTNSWAQVILEGLDLSNDFL